MSSIVYYIFPLSGSVITISILSLNFSFKLPSVIIVYHSTAVLLMSAFDLFRYSTPDVVCPFKDLTESSKVENTTPYCNFLGKGIILLEISLSPLCETVIKLCNHTCLLFIITIIML